MLARVLCFVGQKSGKSKVPWLKSLPPCSLETLAFYYKHERKKKKARKKQKNNKFD